MSLAGSVVTGQGEMVLNEKRGGTQVRWLSCRYLCSLQGDRPRWPLRVSSQSDDSMKYNGGLWLYLCRHQVAFFSCILVGFFVVVVFVFVFVLLCLTKMETIIALFP